MFMSMDLTKKLLCQITIFHFA